MNHGLTERYHSNGKLLLSGEYLVLYGAKAIALPLKLGQTLEIKAGRQEGIIKWKAFERGKLWFSCDLALPDFGIINSSDNATAVTLSKIFAAIATLNTDFRITAPLDIYARLEFDTQWGLGSSSTLIANLARFSNVDPFRLNSMIFEGSGFDIACASVESPVFYRIHEEAMQAGLEYQFADNLYFVYSGSKKNTLGEVRRFVNGSAPRPGDIEQVSKLSDEIAAADNLPSFQRLIAEHEKIMSALLRVPTIRSAYFSDFPGEVKSLGAWGGDFFLAASTLEHDAVVRYFKRKGLHIVFPWRELVLNIKGSL